MKNIICLFHQHLKAFIVDFYDVNAWKELSGVFARCRLCTSQEHTRCGIDSDFLTRLGICDVQCVLLHIETMRLLGDLLRTWSCTTQLQGESVRVDRRLVAVLSCCHLYSVAALHQVEYNVLLPVDEPG